MVNLERPKPRILKEELWWLSMQVGLLKLFHVFWRWKPRSYRNPTDPARVYGPVVVPCRRNGLNILCRQLSVQICSPKREVSDYTTSSATILGDSMSALQAIRNPGSKLGQRVIHPILQVGSEALNRRNFPPSAMDVGALR